MDLQALKTELLAGHPGTGAYNADNEIAANQINAVNRPGDGSVSAMLNYLLVNKSRTNAGTDTVNTSMLGRLILASNAAVASDPFGSGTSITLDMKCSALALLEVARNPKINALPYQASTLQVLLTDMVNAGVMKAADRTAIIALSNNLQSRGSELGLGNVSPSNVADARRLP